jgi:hypothetical protein
VVQNDGTEEEIRRVGAYELIRPIDHLGLPDLWFASREAPPFLAGPSVLLPIDRALARQTGVQARIVRAARRSQATRHEALIRVREVVATDTDLALVLDPVNGCSLDVLLRGSEALSSGFQSEVLLELGARLLEGLHDIHCLPEAEDAPRAHGHVTLRTVIFCADGRARLIGFGLPTATGDSPVHTLWNSRPASRADEMALDLPALGDQYAVGLVLLQLATGRSLASQVPREASQSERATAVERMLRRLSLRGPLTPPLLRLLAPNPAHRFSNAAEAAELMRHPRGPYAADALDALIRRAVAEASEQQDGTEPEGTPVDLLPHRKVAHSATDEQTEATPDFDPMMTLRSKADGEEGQTQQEDFYEPQDTLRHPTDDHAPPSDWDPTGKTDDGMSAVEDDAITAAGTATGNASAQPTPPPAAFEETAPSAMMRDSEEALDLSHTEASEEAGMAVAVARAWAETDGSVQARRFDLSDGSIPLRQDLIEEETSADDSLDVWATKYQPEVSRVVEEDTGALSAEDLEEVAGDWFLDEDPSDMELARTQPKIETLERNPDNRRPQVQPGRTVPYSPAFVPKSAAFPREDPPPPDLVPGAMGLLSAAMPAVQRGSLPREFGETPGRTPENRTTEPGNEAPDRAAETLPHDDDDKTTPFGGERPSEQSVADVAAPSHADSPGPAWVTPSEAPKPSVDHRAFVEGATATGPLPDVRGMAAAAALVTHPPTEASVIAHAPTDTSMTARAPVDAKGVTGPSLTPLERVGDAPPPRRRRKRRKGARSKRGRSTSILRSMPRLWDEQTVWSSSPVVRGLILGLTILLLVALVEGVRRKFDATSPAKVEAQLEAERADDALLK